MKLIFDGTFEELVNRLLYVSEQNGEFVFDVSGEPVICFSPENGGEWIKAVDTEYKNGKTVITPHVEEPHEPKSSLISRVVFKFFYIFLLVSALEIPPAVIWILLFGQDLWYVTFILPATVLALIYFYIKRAEKRAWQEIFVFLMKDIGCLPQDDGKRNFGF